MNPEYAQEGRKILEGSDLVKSTLHLHRISRTWVSARGGPQVLAKVEPSVVNNRGWCENRNGVVEGVSNGRHGVQSY